jgi:hypothetical protein
VAGHPAGADFAVVKVVPIGRISKPAPASAARSLPAASAIRSVVFISAAPVRRVTFRLTLPSASRMSPEV